MTAYGAYGTIFKRGTSTVAQVRSISGPGLEKETIDVTNLSSTGRWREFLSSLRQLGEVEIECFFDPAGTTHELLETDFEADVTQAYSILFPDAATTTWVLNSICTGISPVANLGDALVVTYTIKPSGVPTLD